MVVVVEEAERVMAERVVVVMVVAVTGLVATEAVAREMVAEAEAGSTYPSKSIWQTRSPRRHPPSGSCFVDVSPATNIQDFDYKSHTSPVQAGILEVVME